MKLSELKDKLEVALLQKKILLKIGGLDETGLDSEKKQALQYKLLTVSDLFNDFAAPLGLYEICLLIMSVCKTNDSSTIQDIWKRILSSVLQKVWSTKEEVQSVLRAIHDDTLEEGSVEAIEVEFDSGEWIRPLKEKIIYLGKQLWGKGSDYTFPLLHIIPVLEGQLQHVFLQFTSWDHL
jgi:nuclear pore complex protein Nup155